MEPQTLIYGLDFTSAPSRRKPLVLVQCRYHAATLTLTEITPLATFSGLEAWLHAGEWVAGLDFPFGQPRALAEALQLPLDWTGFVSVIAQMSKPEWVAQVNRFAQAQPTGQKRLFRPTDRHTHAQSPMNMHYIPTGKMFYEGATRLLHSPVSVIPNRPTPDPRIVFEAYPALTVRQLLGRGAGYKSDNAQDQTEGATAQRRRLLERLAEQCQPRYGFALDVPPIFVPLLLNDPTGDTLDALICAVQALWAYNQENYGIPKTIDPLEGWIICPE